MPEAVGLAVACLTVCESVALALDAAALLALVLLMIWSQIAHLLLGFRV